MTEDAALKALTINGAKMLHLDHRCGSQEMSSTVRPAAIVTHFSRRRGWRAMVSAQLQDKVR